MTRPPGQRRPGVGGGTRPGRALGLGWALGLAWLSGCPAPGAGAPEAERSQALALAQAPGHRSLHLRWTPAGLELVQQRAVAGPLQRRRAPPMGPWRVELLDASGAVLFSTRLAAPTVVRAEGLRGELPALVHLPRASFLVSVPEAPGAAAVRVWAQAWTLPGGAPGGEAWVLAGEAALAGAPP